MLNPQKTLDQISDDLIAYLRAELKDSGIGYATHITQLLGGHEAHVYYFRLSSAPPELSKTLVLRLYPEFYGVRRVLNESTSRIFSPTQRSQYHAFT